MTQAPGPVLIGAEIYRSSSYGGRHPLRIPRVSTVMDLARAMGWLPAPRFRTSPRAKPAALALWHDPAYVAALQAAEARGSATEEDTRRHGLGTLSNPVFPEVFRRPATSAGGAMLGAEMIAQGGVAYVPAGGTHHGLRDRANGFCYTNDPVLAILVLRRSGLDRIVYVDIDAHHCDGVQAAFAGDPAVRMISVHEEGRWPFTGALDDTGGGSAFNLPVPRGFNDTEMAAVLDGLILPRVAEFRPQAVVLQCGADALTEDPLSRLCLSNNAHWSVVAALRGMAPAFLVLGGGGYDAWSVGRCWAGVWATLTGDEIPDHLPAAAQAVLRGLMPHARPGRPPAPHMLTTLRDAARPGPVRPEIRDRLAVLAAR